MTPLMINMLKHIAESDFTVVNGAIPNTIDEVGCVWTDVIVLNNRDKGVLCNLIKEGCVIQYGGGRDSGVELTKKGFDVYKKLGG